MVSSTELLPGDICSLVRNRVSAESENSNSSSTPSGETTNKVEGGQICPADMLLISGGLVANEAMLTGESTPHHKVFFFLLILLLFVYFLFWIYFVVSQYLSGSSHNTKQCYHVIPT